MLRGCGTVGQISWETSVPNIDEFKKRVGKPEAHVGDHATRETTPHVAILTPRTSTFDIHECGNKSVGNGE
jgi:hypothetical protein